MEPLNLENQENANRAEPVVWDILKQRLEQQGEAEGVLYLQYLLHARAEQVTEEGTHRRVHFGMYQRFSDYIAQYNAHTGAQMSWLFDTLMEDAGRGMSEDEGLKVAQDIADPPGDAVLEVAQYEEQAGEPVFIARWGHVHNGVPVEQDYIQVLINGKTGQVFALHRKWHDVNRSATVR